MTAVPSVTERTPFAVVPPVDDSIGLLHSVRPMRNDLGAAGFFHYSARLPNMVQLGGQPCTSWTGAAGDTRQSAAHRAMTDALSCYCAAYRYQPFVLPVYPARHAPFRCLAPAEFDWFSSEQYDDPEFPWMRFDDRTPVHWTEAWDPVRDDVEFVPSALVFLPHLLFTTEGEAPIAPATSIGLACHSNLQRAAIEAVWDAIECDALSLLWHRQIAPAQIRIETLSDANYELVSRFERVEGSITLLQVPVDFPVFTCLAVLSSRAAASPARVFAAGTDRDPEAAIRKSLLMLAHAGQYVQILHANMPEFETPAGSPDVADQSGHLRFWADHGNAHLAEFILASRQRIEFDTLAGLPDEGSDQHLAMLIKSVQQSGYRVLLADLTTPDVRDAGFNVLRALIPGLCPILYSVRGRPLGSRRLRQATSSADEIRSCPPHPFPRKAVMT